MFLPLGFPFRLCNFANGQREVDQPGARFGQQAPSECRVVAFRAAVVFVLGARSVVFRSRRHVR